MARLLLAALAVLGAVALAAATSPARDGQRVLVLLDTPATKETHSVFFGALEDKGFKMRYKLADAASLHLQKYGEPLVDHLLLFAPTVEAFGGTVTNEAIMDFVDNGGNVLVAGSSDIADNVRDLASEVGFEFDEANSAVFDHINFAKDDHTLVTSKNVINADIITGGKPSKPIHFRGVGLASDPANPLVIPILTASSTAYSYRMKTDIEDYPHAVGTSTILVGGIQARNNARVVLCGSIDMFSNEFLLDGENDNEKFVTNVALWTFHERGALRAKAPVHHIVGQTQPPREYTINEEVDFALAIDEKVNGKWVPSRMTDVQLEFHRIDPFVRTTLKNDNGVQKVRFTLPDVYGVFQFRVDYRRVGYTFIYSSSQVSVRPLRHTQYERFILSAYPYYTGAFSMMFGLFIFSFVFLYHRD